LAGGDGDHPEAGLTKVQGTLYGTTLTGGENSYNYGTVFQVTSAGAYSVLYSFAGGSIGGGNPKAGLTDVRGTLYGTTAGGGASGDGTVFKITASGESVLHSFAGGADGAQPWAGLTDVNGTLYGTTFRGGTNNSGTVFKITTSGVESAIYSFAGDSNPIADMIDWGGTLYGTTTGGGPSDNGTVFKITTSGAYTQLYSFAGGTDGADPSAALLRVGSALYGTTQSGGAGSCSGGCGTVFKIASSGTERVLYSFAGGSSDGASPYAGLIKVGTTLYGTTFQGGGGGGSQCSGSGISGCGTIYSLTGF